MDKQLNYTWRHDIVKALEEDGSFNMKIWQLNSKTDDNGLEFMENVAYYKREYDYLNRLGLVNRGFCPITGENIDGSFNYAIYERNIFVSEKALGLGKEKKGKFRENFQKNNPNFQSNLEKSKAFLAQENSNAKEAKMHYSTLFIILILSGFGAYKMINPSSILGYLGVIISAILLFFLMTEIRYRLRNIFY
jgi:hypothetical protein